jgi:hypothetical protein
MNARHAACATLVICCAGAGVIGSAGDSMEKFETQQTEKLMGVKISEFPRKGEKQDVLQFKDLAPLQFAISEQKFEGPRVRYWFEHEKTVKATSKENEEFAAYCGSPKDSIILPGHNFKSDLTNRRHRYSILFNFEFYPSDVVVGKMVKDKISPLLFFRDVGTYGDCHALAIDEGGKAHLVVSDLHRENSGRVKTYWAIGDLTSKKWEELYLIEHVPGGLSASSHPKAASTKDTVHVVVCTSTYPGKTGYVDRMTHYPWKRGEKFGKSTVIYEGPQLHTFEIAACRTSNSLVVVYSSKEGVFVLAHQNGSWRGSRLVPAEIKKECDVEVACVGENTFRIRVATTTDRQFQIKLKDR